MYSHLLNSVDVIGRQQDEETKRNEDALEEEDTFVVKFKDLPGITDRSLEAKKYTILWDKTKTPSVETFYKYRCNHIEFYKEKMKVGINM